jgi:hypothetical protein
MARPVHAVTQHRQQTSSPPREALPLIQGPEAASARSACRVFDNELRGILEFSLRQPLYTR